MEFANAANGRVGALRRSILKVSRMAGIGPTATVSRCSFYWFFDSAAASDRINRNIVLTVGF